MILVRAASRAMFIVSCLTLGCQQLSSNPVRELEGVVDRFQKYRRDYDADGQPQSIPRSAFEIDVKKTDSLVSPYAGVVVYTTKSIFADGLSTNSEVKFSVSFAYQERRWVLKTVEASITLERSREEAPMGGMMDQLHEMSWKDVYKPACEKSEREHWQTILAKP